MLCGIEIHQRIAGKKLFCNCVPSESEDRRIHFDRRLHAVRSELGELDAAVRVEALRDRSFRYSAPFQSACLVEADEEPPHPLNPEALSAVLVFSTLLSSKPVDQLHIMRKNVIDGSNTSGFQRTAVVSLGGSVQTPSGSLAIQTICVEEESAGILPADGEKGSEAAYDLSRLGIPLVEIATAPTLKSGKEAQEAALAIGSLLRQTGLVSRGIGTIRQDLNISIPEGARVEIKGVQDLALIEKTVELEVQRQHALVEISTEAKKRLNGKPIEADFVDLTEIFSQTKSPMVGKMLKSGAKVFGFSLSGFAGLLGKQTVPGRRFGSELADYARSAGVKGIIHSDENLDSYGFSEDEISETKAALSVSPKDAFVLVVSSEKKALAALSEVCCRANFLGVPEETRRANPDGTSSYMRPLPGKARLYPETDLAPVIITPAMLSDAASFVKKMGKAQEQKEEALSSLNDEMKKQLSSAKGLLSHNPAFPAVTGSSPEIAAFEAALKAGADAKFAATTITNTLASLKREGVATANLDEQRLVSVLVACKKGIFAKAATADILRAMCRDPPATPESAAKSLGLEKITGKALRALIENEKLDMKGLMAKYRLRVDAAEANEIFGMASP
ncbi:MAG: Glu-tRNA(Gln) amidotransferase subunit GatE [Candidatus Anstonellaceae archaeon]